MLTWIPSRYNIAEMRPLLRTRKYPTGTVVLDDKTHQVLKQLAKREGRTMYGMVRVMTLFYKEWVNKMEWVIDDKDKR